MWACNQLGNNNINYVQLVCASDINHLKKLNRVQVVASNFKVLNENKALLQYQSVSYIK